MFLAKFAPEFVSSLSDRSDNVLVDSLKYATQGTVPLVNIEENPDSYMIKLAAPGLSKEGFVLNLHNRMLSISYQTPKETQASANRAVLQEFYYSDFKRVFALPLSLETDTINAGYQDGILSVHIAKKEEAKQKPARQIAVV